MSSHTHRLAVAAAYASWGVLPLYWKLFDRIEPDIVVAHRVIWSAVFLGIALQIRGELGSCLRSLFSRDRLRRTIPSAFLIGANWLVYLWAIAQHKIVEASLGYFLCPLLTVALGAFLLGEELRRPQRIALALIGAGVLSQVLISGVLPIYAMALALSFALYALGRKRYRVPALEGLFAETVLLSVPAAALLVHRAAHGAPVFGASLADLWLFASTGPITAIPLVLFAWGLERASLRFAGVAQYIAPTIKLVLAILILGEPFRAEMFIGYALVWCGIAAYLAADLIGSPAPSALAPVRVRAR